MRPSGCPLGPEKVIPKQLIVNEHFFFASDNVIEVSGDMTSPSAERYPAALAHAPF
jgi:hypothetical protein